MIDRLPCAKCGRTPWLQLVRYPLLCLACQCGARGPKNSDYEVATELWNEKQKLKSKDLKPGKFRRWLTRNW